MLNLRSCIFAVLITSSTSVSAFPVQLQFSVTNATLNNLSSTVSIPDFRGTILFDLPSTTFSGTDVQGTIFSTWDHIDTLSFSTDTIYENQLFGFSGLAGQGLTNRTANAVENLVDVFDPSRRISGAFLRTISQSASGLFLFELVGQSSMADVPGFDASALADSLSFTSFLDAMDTLKFNITGYGLNSSGGFTNYGLLYGDAHIQAVSAVPEPSTAALLLAGLVSLAFWRSRRRQSPNIGLQATANSVRSYVAPATPHAPAPAYG